MDKDGRALRAWEALGFGLVEIGTVTPRPQPGNPKPRMWRIADHQALINSLGFPSEGAEAVALRIERWRRRFSRLRLAVNIGPNKATPADRVPDDYALLARRFAALADFLVVNVSSPNTPGLRDFQTPAGLRAIVEAIRSAIPAGMRPPPILVKLAPDLDTEILDALGQHLIDLNLGGVVATNTTRQHPPALSAAVAQGGLSGAPLKARAQKMVRELYRLTGGRLPLIGVGGISGASDAYEYVRCGASLVELYTAMVYHGPGLIRQIRRGLVDLLRRDGFRSIGEAVGIDA